MASPIVQTTLQNILGLLVTQINSVTGIATPYIIPTLTEDWFEPGGLADKYVVISNFAGADTEGTTTGGGSATQIWAATCDVSLYVRLDTDTPGRDYNRLTDATFGLLPEWRLVLKAIHQWFPDDGTHSYLVQPSRAVGFSIKPRNYRKTHGWVRMSTKMRLDWWQDLS